MRTFIFTSTTSVFGSVLSPPAGAPAAWLTEDVTHPKNIYGITKLAAENLCELFERTCGLACVVLRTSRFFPEPDDRKDIRQAYDDANAKVNEFLYRRVDLQDVVDAHLLALEKAPAIGFARYIVSATTPFSSEDLTEIRMNAPRVVKRRVPGYEGFMRGGAGQCSRALTGYMSTREQETNFAGGRRTTSDACCN